jgi:hypothetical protein
VRGMMRSCFNASVDFPFASVFVLKLGRRDYIPWLRYMNLKIASG